MACAQVICAGSLDTFQIFVWATKTARLLDVLAAHEGPVVALAFSPTQPLLASGSWDKTVRTWDVFRCARPPCCAHQQRPFARTVFLGLHALTGMPALRFGSCKTKRPLRSCTLMWRLPRV